MIIVIIIVCENGVSNLIELFIGEFFFSGVGALNDVRRVGLVKTKENGVGKNIP